MLITLNQSERDVLFDQDPATDHDGGFQHLLVNFQRRTSQVNGGYSIDLSNKDIDDIKRYATKYKQGGWQNRLLRIFEREFLNNGITF